MNIRVNLRSLFLAATLLTAQALAEPIDYKGIEIDKNKATITFPAQLNMQSGLLEYLIVADTGKTHESLLSTKIQPYDIQVAMLLLGVKPAGKSDSQPPGQITRDYLKTAPELTGAAVDISFTIHGQRLHAEDLIWNLDKNALMTRGAWTYNGSEIYDGRFLAQIDGSIVALVRDSAALANNPRPGNDNDQIWEVYTAATPKVGTPVDVTIQMEQSKQ